jgi:hypothetical protein
MSIRRLMVLVRGLGPNSTVRERMAERHYLGSTVARETQSPQHSENVLGALFGFRPAQVH